jgi:hypothetical protein
MTSIKRLAVSLCAVALTIGAAARPAAAQPREGINVHGEWTILVKNPDGTVASMTAFHNELNVQQSADSLLATLMHGDVVFGHWFIMFATGTLCNPNNSPCTIGDLTSGESAANSTNLTATLPTSGPNAGKLVLNGSVKVSTAGQIGSVETRVIACSLPLPPGGCFASGNNVRPFTNRFLSSVIPVVANQTVDITVVISFS